MITTVNLEFSVSGQTLTAQQEMPYLLASNTVNYVKVHFALGEDWQSVDTVSAVWSGVVGCYATVLDNDGDCFVPQEILARKQRVYVNLVGSDVDNDEVVDRITTYPVNVINVNATAYTCGSETVPLTPSQFEQYVAIVSDLVHSVKDIDRIELNEDYTLTVYYSDGTSYTTESIRGEAGPEGPEGPAGPQGEPGEVTMEQLASVLPTDTASGAIASFPDGSDLFDYLSCICDINPVQDLHGYDKPWVGGAGKNLFNKDTITDNTWINDQGVAQPVSGFWLSDYIPISAETTYFRPDTGSGRNAFYASDKSFVSYVLSANQSITSPQNAAYIRIVGTGTTYTTVQFEKGSTATTYQPYSNICPITGWTGCEVNVANENVWNENWELGAIDGTTGADSASTTRIRCKGYINVKPETSYYLKCGSYGSSTIRTRYYDRNKTYLGATDYDGRSNGANLVRKMPSNCYYFRFDLDTSYGTTYANDISINYPSTDHDYHAHNPNSTVYPITWQTEAGTVYGGTVDVVSGVLTVDRAVVDLSTLTWSGSSGIKLSTDIANVVKAPSENNIPANIVAEKYATSAAAPISANDGKIGIETTGRIQCGSSETPSGMLCYELATPQTYQLTPTQIHALLGTNNVWADCGDVEVQYKADVQRWVEKKLGQ